MLDLLVPVLMGFFVQEVQDPRFQLGLVSDRDFHAEDFFSAIFCRGLGYERTDQAVHDLMFRHVVRLVEENVRAYDLHLVLLQVLVLRPQVTSSLLHPELVYLGSEVFSEVRELLLLVPLQQILDCQPGDHIDLRTPRLGWNGQ